MADVLFRGGVETVMQQTRLAVMMARWAGTSVEFYIDGQLDSSMSYSTSFDFFTDIDIGSVLPDFEASFFGDIDELQVYDFALASSDIGFLHQHPGARVPDKPSCISELQ